MIQQEVVWAEDRGAIMLGEQARASPTSPLCRSRPPWCAPLHVVESAAEFRVTGRIIGQISVVGGHRRLKAP